MGRRERAQEGGAAGERIGLGEVGAAEVAEGVEREAGAGERIERGRRAPQTSARPGRWRGRWRPSRAEAVVQRAARVPGQGVERAGRAAAAQDQHQRGVGLEEAGQVAERGQLARAGRCRWASARRRPRPRRCRAAPPASRGGRRTPQARSPGRRGQRGAGGRGRRGRGRPGRGRAGGVAGARGSPETRGIGAFAACGRPPCMGWWCRRDLLSPRHPERSEGPCPGWLEPSTGKVPRYARDDEGPLTPPWPRPVRPRPP